MSKQKYRWIYCLADPRDRTPFYVGMTRQELRQRLNMHVFRAMHQYSNQESTGPKVREIIFDNKRPLIFELEKVSEDNWIDSEQFWIEYFKFIGADLVNKAIGGKSNTGVKWSDETNQKRREAGLKRDLSHLRDPEVRRRAAESTSKALTGRKLSPEHAEKARKANLGKKRPPDWIHPLARPVSFQGVMYPSAAHAARAIGRSTKYVLARLD